MPSKVRATTVHRLKNVQPTVNGMFDATATGKLLDENFDVREFPISGAPAILYTKQIPPQKEVWCEDLSTLGGQMIHLDRSGGAAVLFIAIDDTVFAIGYGKGYQYIPSILKESNFGLRCALRAVDPDRVREVSRKSLGTSSRQDDTYTPTGLPIAGIGVREWTELVKRLGGVLDAADLGLNHRKHVSMCGAAGLRLSIPVAPERFVDVLRRLNRISNRELPTEFELLEAIQPVADEAVLAKLEAMLDDGLRAGSDMELSFVIPADISQHRHDASGFALQLAGRARTVDEVDVEHVRQLCDGIESPAKALRDGSIRMILGDDPNGQGIDAPAIQWVEASTAIDSRIYFLRDGDWQECGDTYLRSISKRIRELMPDKPDLVLPPWRVGESEGHYNKRLQRELGAATYLCLDTELIKTSVHNGNGFEACDGFTSAQTLVHIKGADRAAPLSHQVNQAHSSTDALCYQAEAREAFSALVAKVSNGHITIPQSFRPKKVILGIKLKGKETTPTSLYPLAQVAIVNMAESLMRHHGVAVEVVGIPELVI